MNTLFDDLPESLSPKLRWLRKHNLDTHYDIELSEGGESPETGEDVRPWVCYVIAIDGVMTHGTGWTEEEAILDYCSKTGTPHYSLE
jgi:hypothetical protein